MSLNHVIITGNLTADPEIRATGSGMLVAKFTVAVNEFYKGEKQSHFFNVTAFGKTAEVLRDWTKKGSSIGVDGRLTQNRWETKEGQKRSMVEIVANRIELMGNSGGGRRNEDNGYNAGSSYNNNSQPSGNTGQNSSGGNQFPEEDDFLNGGDDIPF